MHQIFQYRKLVKKKKKKKKKKLYYIYIHVGICFKFSFSILKFVPTGTHLHFLWILTTILNEKKKQISQLFGIYKTFSKNKNDHFDDLMY